MVFSRSRLFLVLCLLCLAVCLALASCSGKSSSKGKSGKDGAPASPMPIPRADPGYVQYLERQSMLTKAGEMAKVVSGSELAWRSPASHESPDAMLSFADTWVYIHPYTLLTTSRRTTFDQLSDSAMWSVLREIGAKGLYAAPLGGSGGLWAKERASTDTGEDVVQYAFSASAGTDEQYKRLMSAIIDNSALLGSDLVPAATGLGPDFFLAARNLREYPGIYCMVEIPQELWTELPAVAFEFDGTALTPAQIAALSSHGILPGAMRSEHSITRRRGGWAATGEVRGIDGNTKRWVYRYFLNPRLAVLNWEDPSQAAHRILSGGAVRQVGLQGQALIGLRFEALQGLEAASFGALSPPAQDIDMSTSTGPEAPAQVQAAPAQEAAPPAPPEDAAPKKPEKKAPPKTKTASKKADVPVQSRSRHLSIEPALSAAQSMSREIRRYGGWSWLRDDTLPLPALRTFLQAGTDFVFDSAFSPASEHALLTGDATLLRFMGDEVLRLGIDARRLVHVMPNQDGINYNLSHLTWLATQPGGEPATGLRSTVLSQMQAAATKMPPAPIKDNYLFTTAPGLAAMALGVAQDAVSPVGKTPPPGVERSTPGVNKSEQTSLAQGHSLLLFFKAMQPGVLMIAGQDLVGVMPLHWNSMTGSQTGFDVADASRGAYALTASAGSTIVTRQGIPRAMTLYPPADSQVHDKKSFLCNIGKFLRMRGQMGISKGTLVARPKVGGKGSMAQVTRVAGGKGFLVSVCNFSRQPVTERIALSGIQGIGQAMSHITVLGNRGGTYQIEGATLTLNLGPWQGIALYMTSSRSASALVGTEEPEEPAPFFEHTAEQPGEAPPQAPAQAPARPAKSAKPAFKEMGTD